VLDGAYRVLPQASPGANGSNSFRLVLEGYEPADGQPAGEFLRRHRGTCDPGQLGGKSTAEGRLCGPLVNKTPRVTGSATPANTAAAAHPPATIPVRTPAHSPPRPSPSPAQETPATRAIPNNTRQRHTVPQWASWITWVAVFAHCPIAFRACSGRLAFRSPWIRKASIRSAFPASLRSTCSGLRPLPRAWRCSRTTSSSAAAAALLSRLSAVGRSRRFLVWSLSLAISAVAYWRRGRARAGADR
jgi:hypothetical protein